MELTKLSTKGQIILPKSIREIYGWKPGTEFIVETTLGGVLLRPKPHRPSTTVAEVAGCLKYKGPPKTLADMEAAIEKGVKARRARGRY